MKLNILVFIAAMIVLAACSQTKDSPIGIWDDNIKLSAKTAELTAAEDSVVFSTQGTWWWVTDISVGDSVFYRFENVDLESDQYSITVGEIVVARKNSTTLMVKVAENTSDSARIISVGLEAGDYFDRVVITQAAP